MLKSVITDDYEIVLFILSINKSALCVLFFVNCFSQFSDYMLNLHKLTLLLCSVFGWYVFRVSKAENWQQGSPEQNRNHCLISFVFYVHAKVVALFTQFIWTHNFKLAYLYGTILILTVSKMLNMHFVFLLYFV